MKLIVKSHTIELEKEEIINEGEFNVQKCIFEFSQEYNLLTKYAVFSNCNGSYKILIVDNQCDMPIEILRDKETFTLGVYGYYAEDDELKIRYSPIPIFISMENGSYVEDAETTVKPTPTELEQLQTQVTNNKNDIDALKEKCINYDEEVEEIKEDIIEINNNINGINQDISRLDQEQEEQNTNIQSNTDAISEMNSSINDINGEIDAINNNIGVINGNIQTIEGNISSLESTTQSQGQSISALETNLNSEITNRENGDIELQEQIDGIVASSDVKDIVGTYQELLNYDTSKLGNNDIVKVLQDNTHEDAMTYYRWITASSEFEYVGQEGPYYTKSEIDTTLQPYVKNTDYASQTKAGVFKTNSQYANTNVSASGNLIGVVNTYEQYLIKENGVFIAKGTLENVIAGKQLTNKSYVDGLIEQMQNLIEDMDSEFTQSQEIQDTKINLLNTEIDNLVAILDKETAVGTNTLSYDKAKAYNVLDSKIRGNVEQNTLSGKNLFDFDKLIPAMIEYMPVSTTSATYDTITKTVKITSITSDAYIPNIYNNRANIDTINIDVEPNTDYVFSYEIDQDKTQLKSAIMGVNTENRYAYIKQFTPTNEFKFNTGSYTKIAVRIGTTLPSGTITTFSKLQLEKGTERTEYEEYCGGIASPNPDYPQEVKTLKGYNVFDESQLLNASGWTKDEDGYYNGAISSVREYLLENQPIEFKENTQYTFSYLSFGSISTGNGRLEVNYSDGTKDNFSVGRSLTSTKNSYTSKENKTISNMVFAYGTQHNIYIKDFIINEGTIEKPYLPFGKIGKRHIGKNLAINSIITTNNLNIDSKCSLITSKKITISLITNTELSNNSIYLMIDGVDAPEPRVSTITGEANTRVSRTFELSDENFNAIQNGTDLRIRVYKSNAGYTLLEKPQIELGDLSDYEPYKEEIQYIDLDGNEVLTDDEIQIDRLGNAKLIKKWKKIVLDGSENWVKKDLSFVLSGDYNRTTIAISNYFINQGDINWVSSQTKYRGKFTLANEIGKIKIMPMDENITTVELWENWLSTHNTEIFYRLATPQIINLPKCEPLKSLEGTNNVDVLATLEPTYLEETYVYDLRKELEITEWQFYKAFMGTANNNLPSNWSELLITSNVGGEKSSIDIYKEQLVSGDNDVISPGYYISASSNLAVVFNINTTNNTINLKTANYNGSNVATMSQYRIYYR